MDEKCPGIILPINHNIWDNPWINGYCTIVVKINGYYDVPHEMTWNDAMKWEAEMLSDVRNVPRTQIWICHRAKRRISTWFHREKCDVDQIYIALKNLDLTRFNQARKWIQLDNQPKLCTLQNRDWSMKISPELCFDHPKWAEIRGIVMDLTRNKWLSNWQ